MPHYDVGNLNFLFLALETYRSPLVRLYSCHVCIPFFSISGRQRRPRAGVQPQWTQLAVGGWGHLRRQGCAPSALRLHICAPHWRREPCRTCQSRQ